MAMVSGAAAKSAYLDIGSQQSPSPEFVARLAQDMKDESGSDLPISCFVQQVRMQIAGRSREFAYAPSDRFAKRKSTPDTISSDCFRAWAMPE